MFVTGVARLNTPFLADTWTGTVTFRHCLAAAAPARAAIASVVYIIFAVVYLTVKQKVDQRGKVIKSTQRNHSS